MQCHGIETLRDLIPLDLAVPLSFRLSGYVNLSA
jgi:hypothetical protein